LGPSPGAGSVLAINPLTPTHLVRGRWSGRGDLQDHRRGRQLARSQLRVVPTSGHGRGHRSFESGTVYAGTSSSGFYKSTDGGCNWRRAGVPLNSSKQRQLFRPDHRPAGPANPLTRLRVSFSEHRRRGKPGASRAQNMSPVTSAGHRSQIPTTLYSSSLHYTVEGYYGGVSKSTDGAVPGTQYIAGLTEPYDDLPIAGYLETGHRPSDTSDLLRECHPQTRQQQILQDHRWGRLWGCRRPALGRTAGVPHLVVDPRTPTTR